MADPVARTRAQIEDAIYDLRIERQLLEEDMQFDDADAVSVEILRLQDQRASLDACFA